MSTNSTTLAGLRSTFIAAFMTLVAGATAAQEATPIVGQAPLTVASNVPGNMLLVPSVEFPTVDSIANLGAYSTGRTYTGYFDPRKCYKYSYNADETQRHFYPSRKLADNAAPTCSQSDKEWSGNYLNWAATQTIDPFRKALTGGYRVKDETTVTWLEKARSDSNGRGGAYFPDRRIPAPGNNNRTLVSGATPVNWDYFNTRIGQLGHKMWFTADGNLSTGANNVVAYDPDDKIKSGTVYEVSIRVKVCDPSLGVATLESNCVRYGTNYKPEGLIHKYATRMRYSVFGYLNDGSSNRDGGVMRARQKFVGRQKLDPASGNWVDNLNREWDPTTGILVKNPDPNDAQATATAVGTTTDVLAGRTIDNSGVINYINKFGQLTTRDHKSYDPVSELFYAAVRYLKNQGNVLSYSSLSGTANERYLLADAFPVITNWDDPIQYKCQNNAMLGIGDIYTHVDKNLPGNTITTREPSVPTEVSSDTTVNVMTRTQQIAAMEGITISQTGAFSGRDNSAYIAGLAYDAHTVDLRSDASLPGKQTASTYWVDVREGQTLESRRTNQYWLATKYGGFTVPETGFNPDTNGNRALPNTWWSSGETLESGDPRPENFYVASEADKMVSSLTRAFASISETLASGSSLGANASRIDTTTRVYQAQFFAGSWRGELQSYTIHPTTKALVSSSKASEHLPAPASRQIYVHKTTATGAARHAEFKWANLTSTQQEALGSEQVVEFLRGDRREEESAGGTLRTRTGLLGDIVNSTPVYVGKPNASLYANASFTGASSYATFVQNQANRTPVVYVGANDGMLHSFDADTLAEVYAFVPNASIANMKQLSEPGYQHRYFVDGEIAISDVYDTSSTSWKTVLVGTMGRGGPGVFALDVTNPTSVKFLWEKTAADITGLGKNIGRPVIGQVADGDWRVMFGNGPDSSDGSARLIMIGAISGNLTNVDTGATGSNGLTAVVGRDSNGDGFADVAYAGDLRGNLWRFTGLSGTPSSDEMFVARDPSNNAQPITAAPLVGKDPDTGTFWVFFGTGRFLASTDLNDRQVQTWYGIKDDTSFSGAATRSNLVQRRILAQETLNGVTVRTIDEAEDGDTTGRQGWFMDLVPPSGVAAGERMVVPNRFDGQALVGITRIPASRDVCNPSGSSFIMAIDPFTGGRLSSAYFDNNRDNEFDGDDSLNGDVTSGRGSDVGLNDVFYLGDQYYGNADDGTTPQGPRPPGNSRAGRIGWRELVN
jgi:type IV pilus assembly protein PilY1